ncbi:MAG: hypothetical protein ACPGJV_13110 [Bacteriovoracaceae bacterium]
MKTYVYPEDSNSESREALRVIISKTSKDEVQLYTSNPIYYGSNWMNRNAMVNLSKVFATEILSGNRILFHLDSDLNYSDFLNSRLNSTYRNNKKKLHKFKNLLQKQLIKTGNEKLIVYFAPVWTFYSLESWLFISIGKVKNHCSSCFQNSIEFKNLATKKKSDFQDINFSSYKTVIEDRNNRIGKDVLNLELSKKFNFYRAILNLGSFRSFYFENMYNFNFKHKFLATILGFFVK